MPEDFSPPLMDLSLSALRLRWWKQRCAAGKTVIGLWCCPEGVGLGVCPVHGASPAVDDDAILAHGLEPAMVKVGQHVTTKRTVKAAWAKAVTNR